MIRSNRTFMELKFERATIDRCPSARVLIVPLWN